MVGFFCGVISDFIGGFCLVLILCNYTSVFFGFDCGLSRGFLCWV